MMREIRDKISIETINKSYDKLKAYIEKRIKQSGLKPIGQ